MVAADNLQELRSLCPEAKQAAEGAIDFVLLPGLALPGGMQSFLDRLLAVPGAPRRLRESTIFLSTGQLS